MIFAKITFFCALPAEIGINQCRHDMIIIANRTFAANKAPSLPPTLSHDRNVSSEARVPVQGQRQNQPSVAVRQSPSEDQLHKTSFAAKAIGLDSLAALNVFMCAAEACSFTEAGQQLGLSSSAVGKCIARLEQRLSVRLFNRNTRCINVTHEGKTFLESCRRILSELRSIEDELAHAKGVPKGRLHVSMPLDGMLMVPTLGDFIRDYPDVDLDVEFTDLLVDVVDGGYDVVLRSGEVNDSRLKSRRLGTYQFEIVGSPDYFARAGVPLNPEHLLEHACLHRKHPATGKLHPWPFSSPTAINDHVLPTTAMASTLDALVQLAESGVGVACVPSFCAKRQIADGSLVSILKEYVDRTEVVRAIWPASQYQSPKLRAFIDFVAANVLPKSMTTSTAKFGAA
jgi:DNA-binding transcriptional LysR family regulator